jgi:hypothetical protein
MKSRLGSRPYELATRLLLPLGGCTARLGVLLALGVVLIPACRTGSRPPPPPEPARVAATSEPVDAAPPWITMPLSEQKLHDIETWLVLDGPKSTPLWRIEGELVLNLGRLEFARRAAEKGPSEPGEGSTKGASVATQLRTARAGLEGVLSDIDATTAQRRRAQEGIAHSDKLLAQATPNRLKGVPVIARSTWGAAKPRADRMDKNKGGYTRITVHHSADPNPVELDGTTAKTYEAVREIQKAHMDGQKTHYGDIGYHFVIDPYGRVLEGRDLEWQGAHAYGDNNIQNIGICLIGNFDQEKPTQAALDALRREIEGLRAKYDIPKDHVLGHRELRHTDCPGKYLMEWVQSYRGTAASAEARSTSTMGSGSEKEHTATATASKKVKPVLPTHALH